MRNRKILLVICLFASSFFVFAKDYRVNLVQNIQIPGEPYIQNDSLPIIEYSALPEGKLNVRYDFTVESAKDDAEKLLNFKIEFPEEIAHTVSSFEGLKVFTHDENQYPLFFDGDSYAEFFIPVIENARGYVEFQLTIPESFAGSDIPVQVNFEGYRKGVDVDALITIPGVALAGATIAGPTLVVVAGAGVVYMFLKEKIISQKIETTEEEIARIKERYNYFPIQGYVDKYILQIR